MNLNCEDDVFGKLASLYGYKLRELASFCSVREVGDRGQEFQDIGNYYPTT